MKRKPSNPWSGCPPVYGMSAAVMPTRSTPPFPWEQATGGKSSVPSSPRVIRHNTSFILDIRGASRCFILASLLPLYRRSRGERQHERSSFLHPYGCQILEPRLGLHIPLHLGAQGPWVEVMHDKHPGGIFDDDLMHLGGSLLLLGQIKLELGRLDQFVDFWIDVRHHVLRLWRL